MANTMPPSEDPEANEASPSDALEGIDLNRADGPHHQRARVALAIAGVASVAAIILLVANFGDITAFASQAAQAKPSWLLLALLAQISTYVLLATVYGIVLYRLGQKLSIMQLFPIAVAKLFADQALPSGGVSGAAFFLYALAQRNVSQTIAFSAFVFATSAFFVAFLVATVISLIAISAAENAPPALSASVSIFSAIIMFISLVASLFFIYKPKSNPTWFSKIPGIEKAANFIGKAADAIALRPALFAQASLLQFVIRSVDGVTLYLIFLAIAAPTPFGVCFIAIVIASVAATIGPMPMGLGTFEAGMIASLAVYGVPVETALTATLIYRGLSLWLPLLPGFAIIQRELLRKQAAHT